MFSHLKQISFALMLLVPALAQASDRSSQQYKDQLAIELALIKDVKYNHAPNCSPKASVSKSKSKEKNGILEFYRNNKVLVGACLGAGSGLLQAYLYSKKTPYKPEYAASVYGGVLVGAAAGALNVVPEVLVAGNAGGAIGYQYNLRPDPSMGVFPGVIAGTALGLAYNHGKYGALAGGVALGGVLAAQSKVRSEDVVFFSCLGGLAGSAAAVLAPKLNALHTDKIEDLGGAHKVHSSAYESAIDNAPWNVKP